MSRPGSARPTSGCAPCPSAGRSPTPASICSTAVCGRCRLGVPGELFIGGVRRGAAATWTGRTSPPSVSCPTPSPRPGRRGRASTAPATWRATCPAARWSSSAASTIRSRFAGCAIELGEIETAMAQHPGVREAVVVARRSGPGSEARLTAYFVPRQGPSPARVELSELREHLKRKLPDYMVPAAFLALDAFPLNPSGKVDRRALPDPGAGRPDLGAVYVPPTTPAEEKLAAIWREVLGLERIGVHDNFFELGGDSILSIRIVVRANQEHVFLTPRHLFQYQTIAELAVAALQTDFLPVVDEPLLPGLGESDLGGAFDEIEFEGRPD